MAGGRSRGGHTGHTPQIVVIGGQDINHANIADKLTKDVRVIGLSG